MDNITLNAQNENEIKDLLKAVEKITKSVKHIKKGKLDSPIAIPLLAYSFDVIKWAVTELEELNRLNRINLTLHRKHHPKTCKQRLTICRNE